MANPPYVANGIRISTALRFEPQGALVSGPDGLDSIREISEGEHHGILRTSGAWLLLEHGHGQEEAVRALIAGAGLESVATWPDLAGTARVCGGGKCGGNE